MRESRDDEETAATPEYYFRRRLRPRELLPAVGAGVAAGLAAFYIARIFVQRTPLQPRAPGEVGARRIGSRPDGRRG